MLPLLAASPGAWCGTRGRLSPAGGTCLYAPTKFDVQNNACKAKHGLVQRQRWRPLHTLERNLVRPGHRTLLDDSAISLRASRF